ncbi:hypothetical protein DY000_02047145 [Brassica cretica]|uniref:Alcohol dehydrogenase-like C-terminal domain-containing protein n=1 Tax=Brassica cretica TaxID=69181 RepID=A0ABQ7EYB0_BRACR|nr:hypothetical protein DY000_02047145 [Brassica cretica]
MGHDQVNGPRRVKARSEHSSSKRRLRRSGDRGTIAEIAERLRTSREQLAIRRGRRITPYNLSQSSGMASVEAYSLSPFAVLLLLNARLIRVEYNFISWLSSSTRVSAILGCAVFTAYGAMAHAAEIRPGDSIAVIGIGGVGSHCLQIARTFGASDLIAVDVQDDKLEKAKTLGATSWLEPRLSLKEPIAIKKFNCLSSPKTEMVFPQLPSRDQETASLAVLFFTAYGAMAHAAEIHPGDSIAVIGIGGVGSHCLQIARTFGASDLIAVDVQDDKLEKAKTLGATSWLEPRLSLKEPIAIKKFNCLSSPKTEMVFPQLPSRDQETASLVIMLQQLQRRRHKEISSLLIIW